MIIAGVFASMTPSAVNATRGPGTTLVPNVVDSSVIPLVVTPFIVNLILSLAN